MAHDYDGRDTIVPVLLSTEEKKMPYIVTRVRNRDNDVLESGVSHTSRDDLKDRLTDLPDTAHICHMLALQSKTGRQKAEIVYPLESQAPSKTPRGKL